MKVLPGKSVGDPGAVARFQREARALAKLAHPGIIQAYDSGHEGDNHFLVMEYAEGRSLTDVLAEKGTLSPGRAADVVHQSALALAHAHASGLIHRDIKPANLLLTAQGQVKILDLGLARFLQDQVVDPSRTREGVGMGTPDYAAPEQFHDARSADARSDVYSLGCTLYRLLTGKVPFPGSSLSEKYQAHQTQEPTAVEELCPDVPSGLALIVRKMMAKRPADRFSSASEVAEALSPYVAGSSASFQTFKKTTTWEGGQLTTPTMRPRRRLPWFTGTVAVLSLLVAATAIAIAWNQQRPTEKVVELDPNGDKSEEKDRSRPDDKKEPPNLEVKEDPNVLTVSKKSKAKFQTINAALDQVKPGMTIRVLDDSTYDETILLTQSRRYANITLEATNRARIYTPTEGNLITIRSVPGVVLRGFRLGGPKIGKSLLWVTDLCPGARFERLELTTNHNRSVCVELVTFRDSELTAEPVVFRDCVFTAVGAAILINGVSSNYTTPLPTGNVRILNNRIKESGAGILLLGGLKRVQVAGNQIDGCSAAGIQFERFFDETADILVANNTTIECATGFRLWDTKGQGKNICLRNNLFLVSKTPNMAFFNSGGDSNKHRGPGDGKSLLKLWTFGQNWREGKIPATVFEPMRIPKAADDVRLDEITGIERNPDKPGYLRPAKGSPLATKGAGNADPSLPRYIGALPPIGEKEWDWDVTWKSMTEKSSPK